MTAHRSATVRFYFDADALGLAKVIAALRPDATYPGDPGALIHKRLRPPCRIDKPATPDHVWIPDVAQEGWVIITRDSRIQHHRAEVAAVDAHGAKMVALAGADAGSTWLQLEIVMSQWRRIEALAEQAGALHLACHAIGSRQGEARLTAHLPEMPNPRPQRPHDNRRPLNINDGNDKRHD